MSAISSFLHIATRNSCFDFLRRHKMKTEKQAELVAQIELQQPSDLGETRDELLKLVQNEVEKMSSKMKEIYRLSYDEGLTPAKIADNLKLSVQTVSNQKTNVLKSLKKALAQHMSLMFLI